MDPFPIEAHTCVAPGRYRLSRLQSGESLHPLIASFVVLGAENVIGVLLLVVLRANQECEKIRILSSVGGSRGLSTDGCVDEGNLAELGAVSL